MRFTLLFAAVALLRAQGTQPKPKAADYPVHVQLDQVTVAVEYLVRSLPASNGTLVANEYLVVEVAFFGPPMSRLRMSPDNFTLRVNGHGTLTAQLPGMVAGSIKFPNSTGSRGLTGSASAGAGDRSVTIGPRPPQSRFPGDGNDRPPINQPVTTIQKEQEDSIDAKVQNVSLPEGEKTMPCAGLIYFEYRGRTKNIHSLQLFYDGPMGKATLKLLP
jgi:hypothetical protein